MLDVEALKAPVGDPAVGPELRGEVEFGEIEESPRNFGTMSQGELKKLVARCGAMFAQTKDQMLAVVALEAAARLADLTEMRAALALIEHLVADHWEDYHPGPADEMGEARTNELAALKRRAALLLPLSKLPIAKLPGPGDVGFTIAMVKVATAPTPAWDSDQEQKLAEMVEKGNTTKIEADNQRQQAERGRMLRNICRSASVLARDADAAAGVSFDDVTDMGDVESVARAIIAQVDAMRAPLTDFGDALLGIDESFESKLGSSPGLSAVASEVYAMARAAEAFVEAFHVPEPVDGEDPEPAPGGAVAAAAAPTAARPAMALSIDSVRSRADVLVAMDAIVRYYTEQEPTSPVPIMVRRVRNWVNKDFLEVMRDIAPAQSDELTRLLVSPDS